MCLGVLVSEAAADRVRLPRSYWVLRSGTLLDRAGTFVEPTVEQTRPAL